MNKLNEIHIGHLIQCKIKEKNLTYAEVSRQLQVDRSTIYCITNSKSIDIERLIKISEILDYDFISEVYLPILPNAYKERELTLEELRKLLSSASSKLQITITDKKK